jgi:hypothetical protein
MDFLVQTIGDETFSNLHYSIVELEAEIEDAKTINTPAGKKKVKDLILSREVKLKELDKRYKVLLGRNFVTVENTES